MVVALSLAACGDDGGTSDQGESDRISVVATTAQIGALVREVAGDLANLSILMPPGVDPHDYETTPADLRAIGDAELTCLGLERLPQGSITNDVDAAVEPSLLEHRGNTDQPVPPLDGQQVTESNDLDGSRREIGRREFC